MNNAFQDPFTAMAISFLVTLVCYGAFPLLFAKFRETPIRDKHYTIVCYGVNLAVAAGFMAIGSSGTAYVLWTFVFSKIGKSKLREKGILIDKENEENFSYKKELKSGSETQKKNNTTYEVVTRNLETDIKTTNSPHDPAIINIACSEVFPAHETVTEVRNHEQSNQVRFCRKCGFELIEDSNFCSCCGTEVIKEVR